MKMILLTVILACPWLAIPVTIITKGVAVEYNKHKSIFISIYLATIVSCFSYCAYNPSYGDIGIYTNFLARYNNVSFFAFLQNEIVKYIGACNWIFYIIAKCQDYKLICAVPVFIFYYVFTRVTTRVCIEEKCKYKVFLSIYFLGFFMLQLFSIMEHGRFMMAEALLLLAIYRELYEKKIDFLTVVLYIFPIMFHFGIIVFYFLRIMNWIYAKRKLVWFGVLIIGYILILYGNSLYELLPIMIVEYIQKAKLFFSGESEWGVFIFSHYYYRILRFCLFDVAFIIIIYMTRTIIYCHKYCTNNNLPKVKKRFILFLEQFAIFSLLMNFIPSDAYWRFGTGLFIFIPFLLVHVKCYIERYKYQVLSWIFAGLSLGVLLMHMALVHRNNFFILENFLENARQFNIVSVFIKDFLVFIGL